MTLVPVGAAAGAGHTAPAAAPATHAAPATGQTPVYSPFEGKVELVEVRVRFGEPVREGQVVAAVGAMKAKHDVRAPCAGRVASINAEIGSDITQGGQADSHHRGIAPWRSCRAC